MIVVAHDEFNPHKSFGVRPGLRLRDDSLLALSLRRLIEPGSPYWSIVDAKDFVDIQAEIFDAINTIAKPMLSQCQTLEGLIDIHASRNFSNYRASSWLLNRLGRRAQAIQVIEAAIAAAPRAGYRDSVVAWLTAFKSETAFVAGD